MNEYTVVNQLRNEVENLVHLSDGLGWNLHEEAGKKRDLASEQIDHIAASIQRLNHYIQRLQQHISIEQKATDRREVQPDAHTYTVTYSDEGWRVRFSTGSKPSNGSQPEKQSPSLRSL